MTTPTVMAHPEPHRGVVLVTGVIAAVAFVVLRTVVALGGHEPLPVVLIGLVVAGIGAAFIIRGSTRKFEKNLDLPAGAARKGIVAFGVVGYVAKGIAVAVAGVLFVAA